MSVAKVGLALRSLATVFRGSQEFKGTSFQKEYQSSEIEKTEKKRNEKSTSHLCVSSQPVSFCTLQGTYSSSALKLSIPSTKRWVPYGAFDSQLLFWIRCVAPQRCVFFLQKTTPSWMLLGIFGGPRMPPSNSTSQAWDETHRIQEHRTAH